MPALVAFGRRWQVGTDDFVLPGILDSTVKTCWLIAAIIIFLKNDSHVLCENGYFMKIYFYIMITALTLTILTDLSIVNKSMSGHMMDTEVRRLVVPLIYVRLFWEVLDIGWNIVGTIWAYGETLRCVEAEAPGELAFIKRFIICNWMSVGFLTLFLTYLFDPLGREHLSPKTSHDGYIAYEPPATRRSVFWEKRCKLYCCFCCDCSSPDDTMKRDGFHEVGKLLANLVQDYDLLPSDVLAGLIALYHRSELLSKRGNDEHRCEKLHSSFTRKLSFEKNEVITRQPKRELDGEKYSAISTILESRDNDVVMLNHYIKFMNGVNGWIGFMVDNKKLSRKSLSSFWRRLNCCGCLKRRNNNYVVEGDNCCYCSTAALKETTVSKHVKEEDLIHISFANDYYRVPFYLALDHYTKSYVVTLRGTLSGKDVITDLTAWPVPTDIPGLPETFLVHHGILLTARNVKSKIEELGHMTNLRLRYPNYNLVVIGQSLGAAVATILGMLWKSEYPELKVYAFSPPGGLLNLEASIWTASFTTSVVYGTDIIARLSLISLEKFRSKIIEAIEDCRTPKYKLLMGYCSCFCGVYPKVEFQSLEETQGNGDSYIEMEESKKYDVDSKAPHVSITQMYLPGRILHITEIRRSQAEIDSKSEQRFEMRWADRSEFLEIVASPRMYHDHWPWRMLLAFREHLKIRRLSEPPDVSDLQTGGHDNKAFVS